MPAYFFEVYILTSASGQEISIALTQPIAFALNICIIKIVDSSATKVAGLEIYGIILNVVI